MNDVKPAIWKTAPKITLVTGGYYYGSPLAVGLESDYLIYFSSGKTLPILRRYVPLFLEGAGH